MRFWLPTLALLLVPAAFIVERLTPSPLLTFVLSALAIVPLAEWIRRATEQLAARAGPAIGGLLNVTFGNIAELVLALFVLSTGQAEVVKAQITGSIIGNGLLGLGVAILIGTWKRENLRFKQERAGLLGSLLILTVIGLLVPALFDYTERKVSAASHAVSLDEHLSLGVAGLLILVYVANLFYTLYTHRDVFEFEEQERAVNPWSAWMSGGVLLAATAATALMAALVAGALEPVAARIHVSTFFLGMIVLAVIGNAAEYLAAAYFAWKGRMGLTMTLTVGSTIQVALFVAPVLVLTSWVMGQPMNLVFRNPLELIAVAGVAFAVNTIARDGETTWFEGVLLLAVYLMLALAFFFATPLQPGAIT
jgi:Ca2+:H+ antiporter